jgi:hypothetical protein
MSGPETTETSRPDWDRIDEEIACPLCGYNLRGLVEPRCPECGFRFEWPEIIDPARRLHKYLFEHHPERRLWSFRKTLVGGLLPRRFWRSLHPSQPSYPRRLVLYGCIVAGIYLSGLGGLLPVYAVALGWERITWGRRVRPLEAARLNNPRTPQQRDFAKSVTTDYGSIQAYLDEHYPTRVTTVLINRAFGEAWHPWAHFGSLLVLLAWPWVVLAGLMVFRISMRRVRIRPVHVVRCVLYCYDGVAWVGVLLLVCAVVLLVMGIELGGSWVGSPVESMDPVTLVLMLAVLVVSVYRLGIAYRLYMRFDHPFSTVLAAHVIAFLLLANLFLVPYCFLVPYWLTG